MKGFLLALGICATFCIAKATPPTGYKLVFNDEFNESQPLLCPGTGWRPVTPPNKWSCHMPDDKEYGIQLNTGPGEAGDPFYDWNGHLAIMCTWDPSINRYRSGMICSVDPEGNGFKQALGYWEAKIQMPTGTGVFPAFWLETMNELQRSSRTTQMCEVDIVEAYGFDMSKAHQTVHDWTPSSHDNATNNTHVSTIAPALNATWHTYGVLVTATLISFYIDDVLQWTYPAPESASQPMYVMVNYALSRDFPVNLSQAKPCPPSQRMYIEYVRCYSAP